MIQLSISSNGRKVGNKPGANDFVSTEIATKITGAITISFSVHGVAQFKPFDYA